MLHTLQELSFYLHLQAQHLTHFNDNNHSYSIHQPLFIPQSIISHLHKFKYVFNRSSKQGLLHSASNWRRSLLCITRPESVSIIHVRIHSCNLNNGRKFIKHGIYTKMDPPPN
jgi:hypothetical protein